MGDHNISPGFTTANITVSPPLANEQQKEQQFNDSSASPSKHDSVKTIPSGLSTTNATCGTSPNSDSASSENSNRSKPFNLNNNNNNNSNNASRTNKPKSIQQIDQPAGSAAVATAATSRGRQHIKIPNMSNHNGRSPLRSYNNNSNGSNSTRLSTSRTPQNVMYPQNQRRGSIASIGDSSDFSTSLGMPYTMNMNGSSSTLNNMTAANRAAAPISTASSPRNSFSNSFNQTPSSEGSFSFRRYSDNSRKPSTEEVFDLMEREQDAIVLKLMREIQQLKEDNRALRQTINQLTSPSGNSQSRSQSRSSIDSSRRRNSSLYADDELVSVSSSISTTPRSNFANLAVPVTSSRKPSMTLSSAINGNPNDNCNVSPNDHQSTATGKPSFSSPNFESYR